MPEEWIAFKGPVAQIRRGSRIYMEANTRKVAERVLKALNSGEREDSGKMPLLPRGTRFFKKIGTWEFLVVEQPPQVRTIGWRLSDRDQWTTTKKQMRHVAFPYIIFVMAFLEGHVRDVWIFYRNSPLSDKDQALYYSNLPNMMSETSKACLGSLSSEFKVHVTSPLVERAETILAGFWQSSFTQEWTRFWYNGQWLDPRIGSITAWEKATREDPRFMLTIKWKRRGTLQGTLNSIIHDAGARRRALPASTFLEKIRSAISQIGHQP